MQKAIIIGFIQNQLQTAYRNFFLPKLSIKIQNIFHLFTFRAHVSVKVSLHAFHVIVSTVAAHIFFLHLLKFFRFIIFIVVIFVTVVVLMCTLS